MVVSLNDDTLIGGKGSDTYLYKDKNFGNDIIINNNNYLDTNLNSLNNTNLVNSNLNSSNNLNNTLNKDTIKFEGDISK